MFRREAIKEALLDNEASCSTTDNSPVKEARDQPTESTEKKDLPLLKIFLLVNLFQICYTILLSLVKDMTVKRNVGVFEFAFFRSLINMFMSYQVVRHFNISLYDGVPENLKPFMLLRSVAGTLGFIFYTSSPMYIPIGVFQVIFNMSLFIVAIMTWCMLNEKLSPFEVVAMFAAVYGVYLTQKNTSVESSEVNESDGSSNFGYGIPMAIACCFCLSTMAVVTRKMKETNFGLLQFNQALISTIFCGSIMVGVSIYSKSVPFMYESYWTYAELIAAAFANYFGQSLFVIAE